MKLQSRRTTAFAAAGLAGVVTALIAIVVTGLSHDDDTRRCRTATLPVSLSPQAAPDHTIAARYCEPLRWSSPRAVDVLTDGATYNNYWDWPDGSLNTVDRILASGRATVTYDRIGTGRSSRPASSEVTLSADVWVLEQILRWLKPQGFHQVALQLHSYSAVVGIEHATTPGMTAVQLLVVTGFLHTPRDPVVATRLYPANQDHPQWRDRDDGWLTTRPGTRRLSYHGPFVPTSTLDDDERRKNVVSKTAFVGFAAQHAAPPATNPSSRVTAPVVLAVGAQDAIFCGANRVIDCADPAAVDQFERPYYRAAANFQVIVAPAGHSLALDPSSADTFRRVNAAMAAAVAGPNER